MSVEIKPYFAPGERYPALIGVRADGDEHETAYVSKSELVDAVRENHELRELVRWMYRIMDESCAIHHTFERRPINPDILYLVYDRMRERGIEVDG